MISVIALAICELMLLTLIARRKTPGRGSQRTSCAPPYVRPGPNPASGLAPRGSQRTSCAPPYVRPRPGPNPASGLAPRGGLSPVDGVIALAAAAALVGLARLGPFFGAAGVLLGTLLVAALWLDAVLWCIFTIELGPGGVGGVVVSSLYKELAGISEARRFFAENRWFALLPLAALFVHLPLVLPEALGLLRVPVLVYVLFAFRKTAGAEGTTCGRDSLILDFFRARPLPDQPGFRPRPEHAHLLEAQIEPRQKSARFGALPEGTDILLVTLESVASSHLVEADVPFLRDLRARSSASRRHFSPSPTTNNAHLSLYFSDYVEAGMIGASRLGGPAILAAAGYRTIYASAIATEHYGLGSILSRAGFETVVDRKDLRPDPIDGGELSDYALVRQLPELVGDESHPIFLHVHFTCTHVPYRVVDRARFQKRDHDDDRQRFLDGIEEADFLLGELVNGFFRARKERSTPLLAVSSDHGQAFGEHGYRSHGSAVIDAEVDVPFLVSHPGLLPEEVAWSSHFDVFPTLLDLAGIEDTRPGHGASIFGGPRPLELFLWAGHPSRTTTSNFGIAFDDRKIMVDLVTGMCCELTVPEQRLRALEGQEAAYWSVLCARVMCERNVR